MTAYSWIGGTGDWDVGGNWSPSSPAGPPTATDTATITATGPAYTLTIDTADVAQSLTESSSSATIDDTGSLTLGANFTLSAGTFFLSLGGTLSGGTTKLTGGTFVCDGGTLSGVTFDGALDLSDASVHLAGGTVVNTAAGKAGGTIDIGEYSALYFDGTQTFNNATIHLGVTSLGNSTLIEHGVGTVLTLGPNVTIDESGHAGINATRAAGDGIVNQGKISHTSASGGDLHIVGNSFTNSGTITAAASRGALTIDPTTFTNSGTLAISNGEPVTIDATHLSNTGTITLASGASLYLEGSFTLAELGTVANSGGTVYIKGTLDNTGTLNGSSGLGQAVLDGGVVHGGIVTSSALGFSSSGGTLSGVTYDGTLDLLGFGASVHLASGTMVSNAAGKGAGTIDDTGNDSNLYFDDTQTLNNVTMNLGKTVSGASALTEDDSTGAGTVLTLGSGVTIDESGEASIEISGYAGDGIVNQGKINQTAGSGNLHIQGNSFTNSGTITAASSGRGLTIETTTFTNSGTLAVSNGEPVDIETAVAGTGTETISGASTLEFGSAVSSSTTVGSQNIGFTSGGGTLDLTDPTGFYGEVSGFAAGDTVELLGSWAFSGISEAGGLTTLTLARGSTTHGFEFVGDYTQSNFSITSGATSTITHT